MIAMRLILKYLPLFDILFLAGKLHVKARHAV